MYIYKTVVKYILCITAETNLSTDYGGMYLRSLSKTLLVDCNTSGCCPGFSSHPSSATSGANDPVDDILDDPEAIILSGI